MRLKAWLMSYSVSVFIGYKYRVYHIQIATIFCITVSNCIWNSFGYATNYEILNDIIVIIYKMFVVCCIFIGDMFILKTFKPWWILSDENELKHVVQVVQWSNT